jgi:hypothetical protein
MLISMFVEKDEEVDLEENTIENNDLDVIVLA